MAYHWTDRKAAAEARMRHRIGVTPKSEVRAAKAQYRIDQDEERAVLDKLENLKPERNPAAKKFKGKTVIKPKVRKSKQKVVKSEANKKAEGKKDTFEHDFYSEE